MDEHEIMTLDFGILLISETEVMIKRDNGGIHISLSKVKLLNLRTTNNCESTCQEYFH